MINSTIKRIEEKLCKTNISDENRTELCVMLEELKAELEQLSQKDSDRAESVAGFAEVTSHEATRQESNPELLGLSISGLNKSVQDLEIEYPALVRAVNDICKLFSSMGV